MWIAQTGPPDADGRAEARLSTELPEQADEWRGLGMTVVELTKEAFLCDCDSTINMIEVAPDGKRRPGKRSLPPPPPAVEELKLLVSQMDEESAAALVALLKRR
jgi:hypothetical protein